MWAVLRVVLAAGWVGARPDEAQKAHDGAVLMAETTCPVMEFGSVPVIAGGRFSPKKNTRYVTANHKTGTDLGKCIQAISTNRKDFSSVFKGHNHVEGGFTPFAWQLNFVRDPFVMIDSGYIFHRKSAEWWCSQPLSKHVKGQYSVPMTAQAWNEYFFHNRKCGQQPQRMQIDLDAESYAAVLKRFPLASGLLLESMRVILFDATVMASSVKNCDLANTERSTDSTEPPACASVLLDDVMEAGMEGFDDLLVPMLRLKARSMEEFRKTYRLKCSVQSHRAQTHCTNCLSSPVDKSVDASKGVPSDVHQPSVDPVSNTTRSQRIEMIKHLDRAYLGGILARYQELILQSVLRPSGNVTGETGRLRWRRSGA